MAALARARLVLVFIEKVLGGASLFALLAFSIIQFVARNFFDSGFVELDIISRHMVLVLTFMGAALVIEDDRHIKIDIAAALMQDSRKRQLLRPLLLIASAICALFAYNAIRFWRDEWHYATDSTQWQVWMELMLPIGFCMLTLHFLLGGLTLRRKPEQACTE